AITGVITGNNPQTNIISTVTVTATNECGFTSRTFTISLLCPGAPTSVSIPDFSECQFGDIEYDVSPFFTNPPDTTAIFFSAVGLPDGIDIDSNTGVISGTNPNDGFTYSVIITAT